MKNLVVVITRTSDLLFERINNRKPDEEIAGFCEDELEQFLDGNEIFDIEETAFTCTQFIVKALEQNFQWRSIGLIFQEVPLSKIVANILYHECLVWFERFHRIAERICMKYSPKKIELIETHWLWLLVFGGLSKNVDCGRTKIISQDKVKQVLYPFKNISRGFSLFYKSCVNPVLPEQVVSSKRILFFAASARPLEYLRETFYLLLSDGWDIVVAPCGADFKFDMTGVTVPSCDHIPLFMVKRLFRYLIRVQALPLIPISLENKYYSMHLNKLLNILKNDILYYAAYWTAYVISQVKIWKPKVLVTADKIFAVGKAVAEAGKILEIPTLLCPIGYLWDSPWFAELPFRKIVVLGEADRDILIKRGNSSHSIDVTGSPSLDRVVRDNEVESPSGKKNDGTGILEGKPAILYTSHENPRVFLRSFQEKQLIAVLDALGELPRLTRLTIKLHPLEREDRFKEIINAYAVKNKVEIIKGGLVYPLMKSAALLITQASTTAIEACALGVPVLIVNFQPGLEILPHEIYSAALTARAPEEVLPQIKRLLYDKQLREDMNNARAGFIKRHLFKLDGQASLRIANIVNSLIFNGY